MESERSRSIGGGFSASHYRGGRGGFSLVSWGGDTQVIRFCGLGGSLWGWLSWEGMGRYGLIEREGEIGGAVCGLMDR